MRTTELLMALAYCQQSLEHLHATNSERRLHLLRLILAVALALGFFPEWILIALLVVSLALLSRYEGPYNGGSDRMSLLMLCCLCFAHWLPTERSRELALGYLALQLTLSYFMAGWVKVRSVEWRSGQALSDVFGFSAYPVSESLRRLSTHARLMGVMSWSVMLLELLFPVALLHVAMLTVALVLTALFHLANACVFGLNRFLWIWLSAYPALLWFQQRVAS